MKSRTRTKRELEAELDQLRQYVAELEETRAQCQKMEKRVRELSQFQQNVIDNANIWLDVLDADTNVVIWNKAAEKISGFSREEVVGHAKIWEWLYPDKAYRDKITAKAQAIIHKNQVVEDFETTIRTKSGRTKTIAWYSRNLVDENGKIIGSIALGRDVTARKKAEEALRRAYAKLEERVAQRTAELNEANEQLKREMAERQRNYEERERLLHKVQELASEAQRRASLLRAVVESMADAVSISDAHGRSILLNDAARRMFGLEAEESIPFDAALERRYRLRHLDGRPMVYEELPTARALKGETVVGSDLILYNQRIQRDVYLRSTATPIRDERGAIVGAVAVSRDISDLIELDKMKDDFVRVAAHELKTPVTIVKGYAQALLRKERIEPRYERRMLEGINAGVDRMTNIIGDLLDISQLRAGHLDLRRERIDLPDLVSRVLSHMSPLSPRHRLRLVKAEPAAIEGDPERLEQVVVHLVENAVKFSPRGGDIDVAVQVRDGQAVVSVRDYGIGIPKEKQSHIFERFYRAHAGTAYDFGGLGVGLYISREIVHAHGGRIWFQSQEGQGSTFYFSLPLVS